MFRQRHRRGWFNRDRRAHLFEYADVGVEADASQTDRRRCLRCRRRPDRHPPGGQRAQCSGLGAVDLAGVDRRLLVLFRHAFEIRAEVRPALAEHDLEAAIERRARTRPARAARGRIAQAGPRGTRHGSPDASQPFAPLQPAGVGRLRSVEPVEAPPRGGLVEPLPFPLGDDHEPPGRRLAATWLITSSISPTWWSDLLAMIASTGSDGVWCFRNRPAGSHG